MKKAFLGFIILLVILGIGVFYFNFTSNSGPLPPNTPTNSTKPATTTNQPLVTTLAEGLDTPWELAFLPDRSILVTERPGRVRIIDASGNLDSTPIPVQGVKEIGEGGLLGIAVDPNFSQNNYVYLYYTYSSNGLDTLNKVSRYTYSNKNLTNEKVLIDGIPGASNHNGGRLEFGPDNYLYITTGDAQNPSLSQNKNQLAGKILRVDREGNAASGNPFNNRVYSYGHRNSQGLAWNSDGDLYSTEHGPSGGAYGTGQDEVNKITAGNNYGWPTIIGSKTQSGLITPLINSESGVWAPGGAAILGDKLYFTGLRGEAIYTMDLTTSPQVTERFKETYGRLREIKVGPDGMLYVTTSNNDGRGSPNTGDDKVLKINPTALD